jgi:alcohol oxidase
VSDSQDFKTIDRTSRLGKWMGPDGKRSDAAYGYVHPILDSGDNLYLLAESKVVRVLFEGQKAVGVEYVRKYFTFQVPG